MAQEKTATDVVKKIKDGKQVSRKEVKKVLNMMHETSVRRTDARAEYAKRKAHVALLEAMNDSAIIVFKSIDEPWYKIGWNSALIYAYDVAIRACNKKELPTIRKDTDHETRSRDGIVFVRDFKKFAARLQAIGISDCKELNDGICIFDVKKKYTKTELKEFKNTAYRKGDELFALAAKKKVYPELRGIIVKIIGTVLPKCKKMHTFYQMTNGVRIADAVKIMNDAYFEMANSRGEKKEHLINIVKSANVILNELTMIQELEVWSPLEVVEVGGLMIDLKASVERIIKRGDKTED
ncbi:hypothetical protein IJG04_02875 [Candidatus Saccharibacteria bacterium]|nr:hypothetical protein [Candidatus Saccharibacteria bacterium]